MTRRGWSATQPQWTTRPDGRPSAELRDCLRLAVRAPSIHNSQPWRFEVAGATVRVLLDERRRLPVIDPDGREMHLSVGAAIFTLRTAILAQGRHTLVELLPDPREPALAAAIHVGEPGRVSTAARELAAAARRRRTNRRPFRARPVPEAALAACAAAALSEGATLVFPDAIGRYDALSLTRAAEANERADPGYRAELARFTGGPPDRRDGIAAECRGPRAEGLPMRDFDPAAAGEPVAFEAEPTIGVLYSRDDSPLAWLRAGQALQKVLLTATAQGVATSLLTQATEVAPLRAQLAAPGEPHRAQALIRFGYARSSPRTRRRPLRDVLAS